jgi:signal transduction histidine kinase/FixJ family two-component response regulator
VIFARLRQSVRAKLLALMLATTGVALLVAMTALVVYDVRAYHERWVADLTTQAEILGRSSLAALAFDDRRTAFENLQLLRARPAIRAAAIYDESGLLFAAYSRAGSRTNIPEPPPTSGQPQVEEGELALFHRIVDGGRQRGTVYIRAQYEIAERLADYVSILAIVMALSMLAALLTSVWLQREITRPIVNIAEVAHEVMDRRDFSLRARKTTQDEIGYLVDAFNNMLAEIGRRAEALLAADRMKDQFLATLAHELRNPLAPISNALHLLEAAGGRPDMQAHAKQMMARQLKQLVRLVDDLLDVSRITTGKLVLHPEDTELHQVIENAVEIARPLIESRGHRLEIELPAGRVHLRGDTTRLAQVFSNLLNNAARYTQRGGSITVKAAAAADGGICVEVVDTGVGIAPAMLPRIFDMFTQADTSIGRTETGLGVGLALARHLVEMHGGTIEAYSEGVGHGSTFRVRLPVADAPAEAKPAHVAVPEDTAACRVLVVDDNQDFATSLAMILRDLGHDVRVAHDGIEGLRAAEAFQPAIAFLDIGLPGLDGYELARRLRATQGGGCAPVLVAVTGWGQPADKQRAARAGFDQHLVKPIDPGSLPGLLKRAADRRAGSVSGDHRYGAAASARSAEA